MSSFNNDSFSLFASEMVRQANFLKGHMEAQAPSESVKVEKPESSTSSTEFNNDMARQANFLWSQCLPSTSTSNEVEIAPQLAPFKVPFNPHRRASAFDLYSEDELKVQANPVRRASVFDMYTEDELSNAVEVVEPTSKPKTEDAELSVPHADYDYARRSSAQGYYLFSQTLSNSSDHDYDAVVEPPKAEKIMFKRKFVIEPETPANYSWSQVISQGEEAEEKDETSAAEKTPQASFTWAQTLPSLSGTYEEPSEEEEAMYTKPRLAATSSASRTPSSVSSTSSWSIVEPAEPANYHWSQVLPSLSVGA